MDIKRISCSIFLLPTFLILFLILVSSIASASTVQNSSSNAPYAYITSGSNTVSVIDTADNTVTSTVNAGSYPYGVAVTSDGARVYVTNYYSNIVSVIDTADNTVTSTVNVGSYPYGVAVSPDGTKVYVANSDSNTVSVIDTATNKVTSTVNVGSHPYGVAVSADGKKVYVTNYYSNTVSVIDTATNKVTSTVNVGSYPCGVAVSPDGTKVYVTNSYSSTVSVINTATNTVATTVSVGYYPKGVLVTPDGTKVYVANSNSNTVSVIDTATNKVTSTVNVGYYPQGVSVTPDGTKVYVANTNSNTVSVIDTATNKVTSTVNVGSYPIAFGQFIALKLPVVNFSANVTAGNVPLSVKFTDLSKNTTELNWSFGDGADSVEKNPVHTYSIAGNYTVTLTANNSAGSKTKYSHITVVNPDKDIIQGYAPLSVKFLDFSENATSWEWDFGDGSTSTEQNPTHTYNKAGQYTVSLTANNIAGDGAVIKQSYVSVANSLGAPVVDFSGSVTSGA